MSLPHDVSRCAGRPHGFAADAPVCERRETCARYRELLALGDGPVWVPVSPGLCRSGEDYFIGEGE